VFVASHKWRLVVAQVCIRAMSQADCIGPMKLAMKIRRDMIAVACDSFMKMFQLGDDELVEQASTDQSVNESIVHF